MEAEQRFTLTEVEAALDASRIYEKGRVFEELGKIASRRQELGIIEYPAIYQHIDSALDWYAEYETDNLDGEVLHWDLSGVLNRLAEVEMTGRDEYTSLAAEAVLAYMLRTIAWWDFEDWEGPGGTEELAVRAGVDIQKMWQSCDTYLTEQYPGNNFSGDYRQKYGERLRDGFFEPFFERLKTKQSSLVNKV